MRMSDKMGRSRFNMGEEGNRMGWRRVGIFGRMRMRMGIRRGTRTGKKEQNENEMESFGVLGKE